MPLINRNTTAITEAELVALITDKEPEGKTIDYKRALPGKKDEDRKEFLYDVSSFANSAGGHIVYGIDEAGGLPTALVGLPGINPDEEIGRLEQMARDGIRPPIMGLQVAPVRLSVGTTSIVMHIPKSWNPPHQVTFQKAFRFYGRHSNGKYQMDVEELRTIFSLSETVTERLRQFRIARVDSLRAGDGPSKLVEGAQIITHLLPLSAFSGFSRIDLRPLLAQAGLLVDIIGGLNHTRFNADGYVGFSDHGHIQVFRNGCVEGVNVFEARIQPGPSYLPAAFETRLFRHVEFGKRLLKSLAVEPPIVVLVSFIGIKGRRMGVPPSYSTSSLDVFDREPLFIPEIIVEEYGQSAVTEARPLVDGVWNAAGWPGSPRYDDQGNYDPKRL